MGSIQSTYQGCSVGVRIIPAPSTQKRARSGRYRCHIVHAITTSTRAPAAYRGAIAPGSAASRSVNGPFMNHQCSAYVPRPTNRLRPAIAYGAYSSPAVAANPTRKRQPRLRVSVGTTAAGANLVSAASASAAPALMGARASRITRTMAKSPRGSMWPLHATSTTSSGDQRYKSCVRRRLRPVIEATRPNNQAVPRSRPSQSSLAWKIAPPTKAMARKAS